jgi:hypothetical protein
MEEHEQRKRIVQLKAAMKEAGRFAKYAKPVLNLLEENKIKSKYSREKIEYKLPKNYGNLSEKKYVKELFRLSRAIYQEKYKAVPLNCKLVDSPKDLDKIPEAIMVSKEGKIEALQSHSGRGAWIQKLWQFKKEWYPGIEYKGVRYDPKGKLSQLAWGGAFLYKLSEEFRLNKKAYESRVFCQVPLALYDTGIDVVNPHIKSRRLGILVRTFKSPLRLHDFVWEGCFDSYLYLRYGGKSKKEFSMYMADLWTTLGENISKLFDTGLIHGSLSSTNITSEGELADFEPANPITLEGIVESRDKGLRKLVLDILTERTIKNFCKNICLLA